MALPQSDPAALLASLSAHAEEADGQLSWPSLSWLTLQKLGGLRWGIAPAFGGEGCNAVELLKRYESLAAACLTTSFILSQRDAACRRIREHGTETLCQELLPSLADGSRFATVGLSHLTTSRQHVTPVLVAEERGEHFVLNGLMPWVTGASRAHFLLTGAPLQDGRKFLAVPPPALEAIKADPPMELMALAGSVT